MRWSVACLVVCGCAFDHGTASTQDPDAIFPADAATLARFELDGNARDTSGHGHDATLIGGAFVPTSFGMGLKVTGTADQGLDWSAYAAMLQHPYTIEMVLTADSVTCYKKLFGPDQTQPAGWHLCSTFETYPTNFVGPVLAPTIRYYLAMVSTSPTSIDVYEQGLDVGAIDASFTAPPPAAVLFRDDDQSNPRDAFSGTIDAVRISSVARTADEITAVQQTLAGRP